VYREDFIRRLMVKPEALRPVEAPPVLGAKSLAAETNRFYDFDGVSTKAMCATNRDAFRDFVTAMLGETEEAHDDSWKPRVLEWLADYGVQGVVWRNTPGNSGHGWTLVVYFHASSATRMMWGDTKIEVEV
jgi:hypothetical protein